MSVVPWEVQTWRVRKEVPLRTSGDVRYCLAVKRLLVSLLLLSMLASAQARATHWYLDYASNPASAATAHNADFARVTGAGSLRLGEHIQSGSDAAGHCDVCEHAGMAAMAEHGAPMRFFVTTFVRTLIMRESRVCDPPARRADKPPR